MPAEALHVTDTRIHVVAACCTGLWWLMAGACCGLVASRHTRTTRIGRHPLLLLFLVARDPHVLILWCAGVQHCKLCGAMCQQDFIWSFVVLIVTCLGA